MDICLCAPRHGHLSFSLSVCVSFSQSLNLSYPVLRVLVRACRQEELHGGGATVGRGLHESRGAIKLYLREKWECAPRQGHHSTYHSLSLCVLTSQALNLSYLVLRVLVRACRQEELHGGGVTSERGQNECRGAILYMRGKRME